MKTMQAYRFIREFISTGKSASDETETRMMMSDGKILDISHVEYEPETNTVWICAKEYAKC